MARELYLAAHLLDRQLVDREGERCGKVDDVVLEPDDGTGHLYLRALRAGPGALLTRTGRTRLGGWLRRWQAWVDEGADSGTIPVRDVSDIGDHVSLSVSASSLATAGGERWVRDHVIGRIPGSQRRAR